MNALSATKFGAALYVPGHARDRSTKINDFFSQPPNRSTGISEIGSGGDCIDVFKVNGTQEASKERLKALANACIDANISFAYRGPDLEQFKTPAQALKHLNSRDGFFSIRG